MDTDQMIGAVPDALIAAEYAVPNTAPGRGEVVVIEGGAFTVRLNVAEALPNALLAVTEKEAVPIVVGVPLIRPAEAFKLSPGGSDPPTTDQVSGVLPEAVSVSE
jgi:hypothetical protein